MMVFLLFLLLYLSIVAMIVAFGNAVVVAVVFVFANAALVLAKSCCFW